MEFNTVSFNGGNQTQPQGSGNGNIMDIGGYKVKETHNLVYQDAVTFWEPVNPIEDCFITDEDDTTIWLEAVNPDFFSKVTNIWLTIPDTHNGKSVKFTSDSSKFFYGQISLSYISIDCQGGTDPTSDIVSAFGMFASNSCLEQAIFKGCKFDMCIDASAMFQQCNNVGYIGLEDATFEMTSRFTCMFAGCRNLESIKLPNFNTEMAIDMSKMFLYTGLKEADFPSFSNSTGQLQTVEKMFMQTFDIQNVNMPNLDLTNVNTNDMYKDDYYMS